jgi:hypothetical protein
MKSHNWGIIRLAFNVSAWFLVRSTNVIRELFSVLSRLTSAFGH